MDATSSGPSPAGYRDVSPHPPPAAEGSSSRSSSRAPRPKVYFGDGPFEAASSADGLDDEDRAKALQEAEMEKDRDGGLDESEGLLGKREGGGPNLDEELGRRPIQPDRVR
jgi:dipeptidyl aminopeptidase